MKEFCIKNNIDLMKGNINREYLQDIDKAVEKRLANRGFRFSLIQQIIMYNTLTDNDIKQCSSKIFAINCKKLKIIIIKSLKKINY